MSDTFASGGAAYHARPCSVLLFSGLALALGWAVALPIWLSGKGLEWPVAPVFIVCMMFTPSAAAVMTARVAQVPWRLLPRLLGLRPLRPWPRTIKWTGLGIGMAVLVVLAGWAFPVALGVLRPDLEHSQVKELFASGSGAKLPVSIGTLAFLQLLQLPVGIAFTAVATTGEEIGWRGFLLPALSRLGPMKALLVSGAFWGLWHAPIVLLGYNFGEANALGLVLMVGACAVFGVFLGWLRLSRDNIWPSVFAHATVNSLATYQAFFVSAEYDKLLIGPLSLFGCSACVAITGVAMTFLAHRGRRRHAGPGR